MIYVLVVAYNHEINLTKLGSDFKQVVFDNSTDEAIRNKNEKYCKDNGFYYETVKKNIGLPKAYNYVIKKYLKDGDWLSIMDDDTEISERYFSEVNRLTKSGDYLYYLSIFKYRYRRYGPKHIIDVSKYKVKPTKNGEHAEGYLLGINSCSLYSAKLFKQIGLFDENLFMDYVDIDICFRATNAGIKTETIDAELVQHFFSKEKHSYKAVKNRLSIQKHDARVFYKKDIVNGRLRKVWLYHKDIFKFITLYSLYNCWFWCIPLMFVEARKNTIL
ncbi:MAG: glycosyltransferase [Bacilli bacterium]|nr:glycosyltransferase [Bacilli bacterium]